MDRNAELAVVRRAFAKHVLFTAGVRSLRLEEAFAAVAREAFLDPGPWLLRRWGRHVRTPDADPIYVYTNDPVEIDVARRINNGQPSLHALLMAHAGPALGDHVVHIGAGVGYYSAILAQLVGPAGRVTAIEYEDDLAARAKANLVSYRNIEVVAGSGLTVPFDTADVIYVNAGVTGPRDAWLDRLADGGRLILPLTTDQGFRANAPAMASKRGAVFRILRRGDDYAAKWISTVEIFPCVGPRHPAEERALAAALERATVDKVQWLYRNPDVADDRCWLRGDTWCLAYGS